MTTSSRSRVDNRIDRNALAAEHEALIRDLLEGEGLDQDVDPTPMFMSPININGVTMVYGAEEGFQLKAPPLAIDTFTPPIWFERILNFFEMTKRHGLFEEARIRWLRLGRPLVDSSCKKFRALISWFHETVTQRQQQERQANAQIGFPCSDISGRPIAKPKNSALSSWSNGFFALSAGT